MWSNVDKAANFGDAQLNRSRELRPKVVAGGIFAITVDHKYGEVISSVAVDLVKMDVRVKFGNSKSNRSGVILIRAALFVMEDK